MGGCEYFQIQLVTLLTFYFYRILIVFGIVQQVGKFIEELRADVYPPSERRGFGGSSRSRGDPDYDDDDEDYTYEDENDLGSSRP